MGELQVVEVIGMPAGRQACALLAPVASSVIMGTVVPSMRAH